MGSSPPNRLTRLQRELLDGFFRREKRSFLTGGAALAGFYFGHRDTEDLDLFSAPGPELAEAARTVADVAREIAANKICTLISRSEIKDLVDLRILVESGLDLNQAFADAQKKEASAEPATLAWILDQIAIGPKAPLPGSVDPVELDRFRGDFVRLLRSEAFKMARKS